MKKRTLWLVLVAVALVILGAGLLLFRYEAGILLPRYAKTLDLTDRELTESEYESIQAAVPECRVTWSVPLTEKRVSSDTGSLSLEDLRQEDARRLDYFPELTELEVVDPSDYSLLEEFARAHPECRVRYAVTIGDRAWDHTCQAVSVADPEPEALAQALGHMPQVTEVTLSGNLPEAEALLALRSSFPNISFHWTVTLGDQTYSEDTQTLVYEGKPCPEADILRIVSLLPDLTRADVSGCGFSDETMFSLCQAFPQVIFPWQVPIGDSLFPWDTKELDISGIPFDSAQQVEALIPCFPYLERVVMCHCGLDDETMDGLNQKYENIRFVWSVKIKNVYIRTDTTYFYPFKCYRSMVVNDEDIYPLRYCTDIVAIDVGHMGLVTNCEWVRFMPNLQYLVIVETAITDISPLATCKNLVFLEIFTTAITDYTPLLECTALEDLNLGKTYGDPNIIAQMTWLKNIWWSGVDGSRGNPAENAKPILTEALPNTELRFHLDTPNVNNGWRQLENYRKMRDAMDVFCLK